MTQHTAINANAIIASMVQNYVHLTRDARSMEQFLGEMSRGHLVAMAGELARDEKDRIQLLRHYTRNVFESMLTRDLTQIEVEFARYTEKDRRLPHCI